MKKIKFGALVLAILLAGSSFASCNKGGETHRKKQKAKTELGRPNRQNLIPLPLSFPMT